MSLCIICRGKAYKVLAQSAKLRKGKTLKFPLTKEAATYLSLHGRSCTTERNLSVSVISVSH
jgi:hypothetical protein